MGAKELLIIAVGLSMDALAVAVCKGASMKKSCLKNEITVGLWFGVFQALMPIIGYYLGCSFCEYIKEFDHWVAFALLSLIGFNMIKESFSPFEEYKPDVSFKTMLVMAIATSIDALAVGITFALVGCSIFVSSAVIGIITFILSLVGVRLGRLFGKKFKSKAELAGGIILILMAVKILLEHLGIL